MYPHNQYIHTYIMTGTAEQTGVSWDLAGCVVRQALCYRTTSLVHIVQLKGNLKVCH